MSADDCLGLRQCFARLDALVPRVIKLGITHTSAVSEPRTTATAATRFSRFRDDTTFETYGTECRRRGCWCLQYVCGHWSKHKDRNMKSATAWSTRGKSTWPWTYVCRHSRPQPSCDKCFCYRHLRNSYTKHHPGRNNCLCLIFRKCHTLSTLYHS